MKLVEILAKELKEWPEGVCICQDEDKGCYSWTDVPKWGAWQWVVTTTAHVVKSIDLTEFAEDYQTAIITKEMWEAEKAKMIVQNIPESESFDPIYCRDRIKEIDGLVESLEEERVSLVQALEDEGFALISAVLVNATPVEDMSDWLNWKAGDLLTLSKGASDYDFTVGKNYGFIRVDEDGDILVLDDSGEENGYQVTAGMFKWHSRPQ